MVTTPPATGTSVVRRLLTEVFDARDPAPLRQLVEAPALLDCARMLALLSAFPDGRLAIEDIIGDGGQVAVRLTLRGTHLGPLAGQPPSERPVVLPVYATYRVHRGRIVEAWLRWDGERLRAQLGAGAGPDEPILELDEIQGNVVPGMSKNHLALLAFRIADPSGAQAALATLADEVATAAEVLAFKQVFTATRDRRGQAGAVCATWCNVALSFPALRALAPDAGQFADAAFRGGRHRQAATADLPDLLLIVASDVASELAREVRRLTGLLAPALTLLADRRGATLPDPRHAEEHFGFRDGVSQPGVRGRLPDPPHPPLTARRNPVNPDHGRPGQVLVWPGEFVFGYPRQGPDARVPGPVASDAPSWARNGSFLVYARYRQDVAEFESFLRDASARLAAAEPSLAGLTAERLGAMVIGRWRSGAPLVRAPAADDPALGADGCANNHFRFQQPSPALTGGGGGECVDDRPPAPADPDGLVCPYASHIRKSYVRDDLGATAGLPHRMLRRGVPYGPPGDDDQDRGLLFFAYLTSIERQFAHVLDHWVGGPDLRAPGEGVDVLVHPDGAFGLPVRDGDQTRFVPLKPERPLTTFTEGGYFFAPSVSALRQLAGAGRR